MSGRRWMLFIDGENLAIRGAAVAAANDVTLHPGSYYLKDVFVWMPGAPATGAITQPVLGNTLENFAVRAHYYTSLVGDEPKILDTRKSLRALGFQPHVFKRSPSQKKAKGVDITLTKDLLVNAFQDNYDVAVLVAADGDYVPVVEEVKRMGKIMYVAFFIHEPEGGFSTELGLSSDKNFTLTKTFINAWKNVSKPRPPGAAKETSPS